MSATQGVLGANWKLGSIAVLGMVAAWIIPSWIMRSPAAYNCTDLIPEVVSLSVDNARGLQNVKLVDIVEQRTVSAGTDKSIECEGLGIFNDASKVRINYRVYQEYGKPWLTYEVAP